MSVIDEVWVERRRQVADEGWDADHDDQHDEGELARAAICYALPRHHVMRTAPALEVTIDLRRVLWPWQDGWWKPKDRRRDLIRAAALIIAEVERLDRVRPFPVGVTS